MLANARAAGRDGRGYRLVGAGPDHVIAHVSPLHRRQADRATPHRTLQRGPRALHQTLAGPPPAAASAGEPSHGFPGSHGPPEQEVNGGWLRHRYRAADGPRWTKFLEATMLPPARRG